jgi:Cu2+-containing amine oxidase
MYYKACPDDNEYAHPMDLCPVVDLYAGKVIHIDAYEQPPAIPMRAVNYHRYVQLNATAALSCVLCICIPAASIVCQRDRLVPYVRVESKSEMSKKRYVIELHFVIIL